MNYTTIQGVVTMMIACLAMHTACTAGPQLDRIMIPATGMTLSVSDRTPATGLTPGSKRNKSSSGVITPS